MKNEHTFFIDCEDCGVKMNENTPNEFLHTLFIEGIAVGEHHFCKKCVGRLDAVKAAAE